MGGWPCGGGHREMRGQIAPRLSVVPGGFSLGGLPLWLQLTVCFGRCLNPAVAGHLPDAHQLPGHEGPRAVLLG